MERLHVVQFAGFGEQIGDLVLTPRSQRGVERVGRQVHDGGELLPLPTTYDGRPFSHASRATASSGPDRVAAPPPSNEIHPLVYEVEVNADLPALDRLATLVHELAHLYCGHQGTTSAELWPDRRGGSESRNEIEAESITYMVIARLDPSVEMGDYILEHASDSDATLPDLALDLMFKTAGAIIEMGNKRLPARDRT